MGPTRGPPGSCRPQMGPMCAPWIIPSGYIGQLQKYKYGSLRVNISVHHDHPITTGNYSWTVGDNPLWSIACQTDPIVAVAHVALRTSDPNQRPFISLYSSKHSSTTRQQNIQLILQSQQWLIIENTDLYLISLIFIGNLINPQK